MSYYDYKSSTAIESFKISFYGIIMLAMRRADTDNLEILKRAWPEQWAELQSRYHAPGGLLPGEEEA